MSAALALVIALGSSGPAHAAMQGAHARGLIEQACIETGMRRDRVEQMARERRWRRQRLTSRDRSPGSWNLAFHAEGGLVMLGYDARYGDGDPSIAAVCSVSVDRAPPDLAEDIAAFAASLGLIDEVPFLDPPAGSAPMRSWSRFGDKTLTYAAAPDGRAVISLSRQVVSTLPAPASPPGN